MLPPLPQRLMVPPKQVAVGPVMEMDGVNTTAVMVLVNRQPVAVKVAMAE